jgi:hypothetical protein
MSEIQTDSGMWAAIEGTLSGSPHRARTGLTMRATLLATDAKDNEVRVLLVIRRGPAYDDMARLQAGARVRVIGKLALPMDGGDDGTKAHLWIDVDSAVRIGAERTQHSRIERLMKRFKFWSTK